MFCLLPYLTCISLLSDAPKVQFDMTVRFNLPDLNTSQKERMLRDQFQNLSGYYNVSVTPLKSSERTTNDSSVKAMFDYNNDNINKIYNGGLKDEIKSKLEDKVRTSHGNITLIGEISQTNVPRDELDKVFQCSTNYDGYTLSLENTGVFCKSPCNDTSYCNNHGTCSHLVTGPKCSCDREGMYEFSGDRCEHSTIHTTAFHKILFGTLAGLLLAAILGGIIFYLFRWNSRSQSHHLFKDNSSASAENHWGTFKDRRNIPWISNIPETSLGRSLSTTPRDDSRYLQPTLEHVDTQKQVNIFMNL
uniref:EGF-like domain-containing protein n=1 Tax=Eptatretus burgeri TaxID=7764 RepID=A0A8C4WUX5_EPTBU